MLIGAIVLATASQLDATPLTLLSLHNEPAVPPITAAPDPGPDPSGPGPDDDDDSPDEARVITANVWVPPDELQYFSGAAYEIRAAVVLDLAADLSGEDCDVETTICAFSSEPLQINAAPELKMRVSETTPGCSAESPEGCALEISRPDQWVVKRWDGLDRLDWVWEARVKPDAHDASGVEITLQAQTVANSETGPLVIDLDDDISKEISIVIHPQLEILEDALNTEDATYESSIRGTAGADRTISFSLPENEELLQPIYATLLLPDGTTALKSEARRSIEAGGSAEWNLTLGAAGVETVHVELSGEVEIDSRLFSSTGRRYPVQLTIESKPQGVVQRTFDFLSSLGVLATSAAAILGLLGVKKREQVHQAVTRALGRKSSDGSDDGYL